MQTIEEKKPKEQDDLPIDFSDHSRIYAAMLDAEMTLRHLYYWDECPQYKRDEIQERVNELVHARSLWRGKKLRKISISEDTGIDYADSGAWRSYEVSATGATLDELIADATICEVDQDGGELNSYSLDDATTEVQRAALAIFTRKLGL